MNQERIKLLESYLKEDPSDPFNRHALAMEYYDTNSEKSLQLLTENLIDNPDYLPTYFKAAHLLWEKENWEEAANVFKKGIQLAKNQEDSKALSELNAAYLNFQFDMD